MDSKLPILLAQCKAFHTVEEIGKEIATLLKIDSVNDFDIHISLPYSSIETIKKQFATDKIKFGAEVVLNADEDSFTSSIAGRMLVDANAEFVLIGSMQDRIDHADHLKNKVKAALNHHVRPFVCVGETLQEHQDKNAKSVLSAQLKDALEGFSPEDMKNVYLVYNAEWICRTPWEKDSVDLKEAYQNFSEAVLESLGADVIPPSQIIIAVPGYSSDIGELIHTLKDAVPLQGYSIGILSSSAEYLQPLTGQKPDLIQEKPKESLVIPAIEKIAEAAEQEIVLPANEEIAAPKPKRTRKPKSPKQEEENKENENV